LKSKGQDGENDFEMPQTESDKENWEPEDHSQAKTTGRSRGLQSQAPFQRRSRQVLGENTDVLSQSSSLGAMMAREKKQRPGRKSRGADSENVRPDNDEEIASFMGSGRASSTRSSVSGGEEMGCVEGLLALANWK